MPTVFQEQPTEKEKERSKEEPVPEEVKVEDISKLTGKAKKNAIKNQKKQEQKAKLPPKKDVELDFDLCDFPVAYSKEDLVKNWFEFNDSTVTAIMPGTLQNTFGGHSGSAYMLIYRQRKLNN